MITFVTSNPFTIGTESMNPQNRFVEELLFNIKKNNVRALFVCSDPNTHEFTDACAASMRKGLEEIGIQFDAFNVLDGRNPDWTRQFIDNSEVIILAGGHVPTQNKFFKQIHLRENLKHFRGVVIGISAGSMNMADSVFSHPELPGETLDPTYELQFPGLGLTTRNILPHWQNLQYVVLDGKRMLEDIVFPTCLEHVFFALPDGSYIYSNGEREELRGEAYLISNNQCRLVCSTGDVLILQTNFKKNVSKVP
ncbi:MAG: Type 1 glutamine amidotransferase-like domain-containing protein [Bacteroidales bacterium]|nr:Type 1 glutamine amidotransferase-like domain-containing protein [Bacteroidales bacterium]